MSVNVKRNGNLIPIASLAKMITPVGLGDCYSTEERHVGCWIDGKPLYQKTISIPTVATGTSYPHGISNIDKIWIYDIKAKRNSSWFTSGHIFEDSYNNIAESFSAIVSTTDIYTYVYGNTVTECNITVQYTKTTDTAGSGIWTPSGECAVHYGTAEQVIGTWIDGKPLYRKVVTGLNVTAAWQQQYYPNVAIQAPIANVKEVINARAIMNYNNGISRNSICSVIVNDTNNTWALIVFDDITINTLILEYTKTTD